MNEYEELQRWLDEEAEHDISTEEMLQEYGLTMETVPKQADLYKNRFFNLLKKYGICKDNISIMIAELDKLLFEQQNQELLFLYTALATERGLLFGTTEDDDQKAFIWLKQSLNAKKFYQAVSMEKNYEMRLHQLSKLSNIKDEEETDREEQLSLYQMAIQHDFLYRGRKSNVFLANIAELVRKVNLYPELKVIKPQVYSAILSRKHKLMLERKDYSPNFDNIFQRKEYKINMDNGKNFDTYQSYLELYDQLRRHYQDESDIDFSDYCFAHLSNLSEWYYQNCEPNEEIPMTLERMADQLTTQIALKSPVEIITKQPVLEIAYQNILLDEPDWLEMIWKVQKGMDISAFCETLYQKAGGIKICKDKKLALQYAELYLCMFMEDINRRILMDAFRYFL